MNGRLRNAEGNPKLQGRIKGLGEGNGKAEERKASTQGAGTVIPAQIFGEPSIWEHIGAEGAERAGRSSRH